LPLYLIPPSVFWLPEVNLANLELRPKKVPNYIFQDLTGTTVNLDDFKFAYLDFLIMALENK